MMTLDKINRGQTVKVISVHGEGTSLRRRLLVMGFTPNTLITFLRNAPLGDPIELNVRGYSLTIRQVDARLVEVCNEQ